MLGVINKIGLLIDNIGKQICEVPNLSEDDAIIDDPQEIQRLLSDGFRDQNKYAVWQEENGSARGQPFCWGKIIGLKDDTIELKLEYVKKVRINKDSPVYIFSYKNKIVFKLPIDVMGLNLLIIKIPKEVLKVEDDYLEKKSVISKEDEKKFMIQRAEKRSKSEGDNFTQFKKTGLYNNKSLKVRLYDLSPNGMSFLVTNPEGYEVEENINILFINQKAFDPPLKGEIRSVREMDDGHFKIGIQFKTQSKKKSA